MYNKQNQIKLKVKFPNYKQKNVFHIEFTGTMIRFSILHFRKKVYTENHNFGPIDLL